jgi:hypothetical protein
MLKFRKAIKNDRKKIQKFIDLNFKKNHILAKNTKFFKWLYSDKQINCILTLNKNEILGIYLYIPLSHFDKKLHKNHIFFSTWTVKGFKKNISINENKEGIAIALKIINNIYQYFKSYLIINVGIDIRLKKFHEYKKIKSYISNHHFIISPYIKKFNILQKCSHLIKKFNKKKNKAKINFKKIKKLNDLKKLETEDLFNYQIPLKSNDYLINRYLKHPIYKYHIYAISRKKTIALCVFRVAKAKNTNVIRIIDYVGSNKSFRYLNHFFYKILKLYKAEYLDFYSFGIPLSDLKKSGLIDKNNYKDLIIPEYFEPFLYKNIVIPVGYLNYVTKGNVRIFKGDGDQDRPSINTQR